MKKYIMNLIPFGVGIGCILAFNLIGSKINSEGFVEEPFFLIPIAYISFGIGIVMLIVKVISLYCINKKAIK